MLDYSQSHLYVVSLGNETKQVVISSISLTIHI